MQKVIYSAGPLKIHGLTNGQTGPVVIALHGYLDNAASMQCLAPYFTHYQFVALDFAGHGQSDHRPIGAHYHQMDFVQDLHSIILEQEWQDVILVGHSMGGIIASLYAAVFPEKVRSVFSIDACGPLTQPAHTSATQIRQSIESRLGKQRAQNTVPKSIDLVRAIQARCAITDISPEHAEIILTRNTTLLADGQRVWSSDPRLRTKSTLRLLESQAEALMKEIRCPVGFACASASFKQVSDVYKERQDWWNESYIYEFIGGHHIHMEQTALVGKCIMKFVEQM
jgi:pimeloyl-ACP methyl ester carboxylesterase